MRRILGIIFLPALLCCASGIAPQQELAFTSITADGDYLVLKASIPSGVTQVQLETRADLSTPWQPGPLLEVTNTGEVQFVIPKPDAPIQFMRLAVLNGNSASDGVKYITTAPLSASPPRSGDAVFDFKGRIDGSDKIIITRGGAFWKHINWDWPPGPVTVNGTTWSQLAQNFLTTASDQKFLPEPFSLDSATLEVLRGRDVVAMEHTKDALIVYVNDTPSGSDDYQFKVHFHPATVSEIGTKARLKISAQIDGSDCVRITAAGATWRHLNYGPPTNVRVNGRPWNPGETPALENAGATRFLPAGVNFQSARIVGRTGRDLVTCCGDENGLTVWFADNPNGADNYEIEIAFGR